MKQKSNDQNQEAFFGGLNQKEVFLLFDVIRLYQIVSAANKDLAFKILRLREVLGGEVLILHKI